MTNNFEIKCADCGAVLSHVCSDNFLEAVKRIYAYKPESINVEFSELPGYEKGDDEAPFFSEAFLYPLMGKEDARTILAMLDNVVRAAGIDPYDIQRKAGQ